MQTHVEVRWRRGVLLGTMLFALLPIGLGIAFLRDPSRMIQSGPPFNTLVMIVVCGAVMLVAGVVVVGAVLRIWIGRLPAMRIVDEEFTAYRVLGLPLRAPVAGVRIGESEKWIVIEAGRTMRIGRHGVVASDVPAFARYLVEGGGEWSGPDVGE